MSQSSQLTHHHVRTLIDDLDHDQYAVSIPKLSIIISKAVQFVAVRTYQSLSAAPTSLAVVAGTADYSLVSMPNAIRQIILSSDGTELMRVPIEQMNAMFKQDTAVAAGRGAPRYVSVYEINNPLTGGETTAKLRLGPTPVANDSLKIYYDLIPARDVGDYVEGSNAVLPLSPPLINAVESFAAAECIMGMDEEDLKRRKISRGYAQVLQGNAERMIAESNFRQRMLEAQDCVDEESVY